MFFTRFSSPSLLQRTGFYKLPLASCSYMRPYSCRDENKTSHEVAGFVPLTCFHPIGREGVYIFRQMGYNNYSPRKKKEKTYAAMMRAALEEFGLELVYLHGVVGGVLVTCADEGVSSRLSALLERINHLLTDVKKRLTILQTAEVTLDGYCACHGVFGY
ncbi:hypothetical protein ZOSMA_159G00160 [Zostera marina]|uniref:Uncharacterized protein n=1 Tax=Zostera marina TaxID=29655 RepID=A0A0K9PX76_ZOSMR|nr:hypothetical protein ZOSMA_159G00160 [Zostera marina]